MSGLLSALCRFWGPAANLGDFMSLLSMICDF
jgi:hypothetical protein